MNKKVAIFGLVIVIGLTLGGEWLSSRLLGRHQQQNMLQQAAARIAELPQHFGAWQMRSEEPLSTSAVQVLECPAYFNRQYVNAETGEIVHATLLVGPAGPMVAHRPEVCFCGSYELLTEPKPITIRKDGEGTDEFHMSQFQAKSLLGERVSTYYGWLRGTHWEAPQNARLALGGEPLLFKLQVVCGIDAETVAAEDLGSHGADDAAVRLLQDLLPVLRSQLAAPKQ